MAAIDVDEILQTKDERKRNRRSADENSTPETPQLKKAKIDNGNASAGSASIDNAESGDFLPDADALEGVTLDEPSVKKLLLNFEKRVLKNTESRIKFPDQPDKFMESEIELNVAVQELHSAATVPHLYHLLSSTNTIEILLQLLAHENADISCAVVDLLQELTDVDTLNESEEGANSLVDALLSGQIIAVLVQNIERLDETKKDESDGVYNTLAIIENIVDFRPDVCASAVTQGLLSWILKRLRAKIPYDANRFYCSEILAVLLQSNDDCKRALGEQDGIDILLQQLAVYKRHNPSSNDEIEYMENLFNCLCAALLFSENRGKFLDGEGLQLMNLMLREKKMSRESALRVVDYATTGPDGKANCDKFVDILGLRTLFPLFMKTPGRQQRKGHSAEEHEEHVCSIIASLLKNCGDNQRQRIFSKFMENDHEKTERLTELHFKYWEKVERFEKDASKRRRKDEEYDEEEMYLEKLDAGLFTLQIVDYILAEIYVNGAQTAKERLTKILNMKSGSLKTVKNNLQQMAENLGERENKRGKDGSNERLMNLIQNL